MKRTITKRLDELEKLLLSGKGKMKVYLLNQDGSKKFLYQYPYERDAETLINLGEGFMPSSFTLPALPNKGVSTRS